MSPAGPSQAPQSLEQLEQLARSSQDALQELRISILGLRLSDPDGEANISLLLGDGDMVLPRFTMVGGGEVRGTVGASVSPNGMPSLMLQQQGGQSIQCSVNDSMASMGIRDNVGHIRLSVDKDGDGIIVLEEGDGQGSTCLRRLTDGTGGLLISDSGGIERARVEVDSGGSPVLRLRNQDQQTIWCAP